MSRQKLIWKGNKWNWLIDSQDSSWYETLIESCKFVRYWMSSTVSPPLVRGRLRYLLGCLARGPGEGRQGKSNRRSTLLRKQSTADNTKCAHFDSSFQNYVRWVEDAPAIVNKMHRPPGDDPRHWPQAWAMPTMHTNTNVERVDMGVPDISGAFPQEYVQYDQPGFIQVPGMAYPGMPTSPAQVRG